MVLGPSRKRAHARAPLRKNALSYLNEKSEREYRIKNRELELHERKMEQHKLALEERRVKLDESRLELEKEERMHKIELEKQLTLTVNWETVDRSIIAVATNVTGFFASTKRMNMLPIGKCFLHFNITL
ncbi:hypothetical protein JTB14_003545 [Gonioctena quinquepunctata]|nr:hypothetical protein JTB14_003545 [Gonioctena quinquepunctata]